MERDRWPVVSLILGGCRNSRRPEDAPTPGGAGECSAFGSVYAGMPGRWHRRWLAGARSRGLDALHRAAADAEVGRDPQYAAVALGQR